MKRSLAAGGPTSSMRQEPSPQRNDTSARPLLSQSPVQASIGGEGSTKRWMTGTSAASRRWPLFTMTSTSEVPGQSTTRSRSPSPSTSQAYARLGLVPAPVGMERPFTPPVPLVLMAWRLGTGTMASSRPSPSRSARAMHAPGAAGRALAGASRCSSPAASTLAQRTSGAVASTCQRRHSALGPPGAKATSWGSLPGVAHRLRPFSVMPLSA